MARCADCGFLCIRNKDRDLIEVELVKRDTGGYPDGRHGQDFGPEPVCLVSAHRVDLEFDKTQESTAKEFLHVIQCGRDLAITRSATPGLVLVLAGYF